MNCRFLPRGAKGQKVSTARAWKILEDVEELPNKKQTSHDSHDSHNAIIFTILIILIFLIVSVILFLTTTIKALRFYRSFPYKIQPGTALEPTYLTFKPFKHSNLQFPDSNLAPAFPT